MKKVFLLIASLSLAFPAFAGDYVVVVNKGGPVADITAADLKRVFTGKKTDFGGVPAVPVAFDLNNPTSAQFLTEVLGMSVSEYRSFWMAQQVKGTGSAPVVQKTPDALIAAVSGAPGGIGFIEKAKATDAVKVIAVK